ncbi:transmembrane protein 244 isoform X2 [Phyllostomus hastatus]|uniref:transmembrane protein 244 isoform X2 n=1 Tax=Phyllostomus hastatus TaxID=9423 RepID=UPI001E6813C2|nr:transmembrane protein 244 isoform X2 [Phyllostomus hastatus]
MALQVRVAPSKVVLQNLLICVILFYTVYYVVLSVGCMALQVYELSLLAPFDFKTCPSWLNTSYQVLLISTEVTYFICGLLFALIVEEWVWDYAISVTILHVAITSTVPWSIQGLISLQLKNTQFSNELLHSRITAIGKCQNLHTLASIS